MKAFWKSKTFWLNILALFTELLDILPLDPSITNAIPTIPIEALAAANLGARWVTKDPVTIDPRKIDG